MSATAGSSRSCPPELLERELRRLEPIAETLARRYFVPGADADDVRQLARIGIWQALEAWDGERDPKPLAWTIAERRVVDAMKAAHAVGRTAQREAVSTVRRSDGEHEHALEHVPAPVPIAELVERRAELRAIVAALPTLTPLERAGLAAAVRGEVYASRAGCTGKVADNAAQRARRKLRAAAASVAAA